MRKSLLVMMCFSAILLLGFQVTGQYGRAFSLEATVDIRPDTLNLNMRGQWITAYIELPEGFDASDIDPATVLLEHLFQAERSEIEADALVVRFDAYSVTVYLQAQLSHLGVHRTTADLLVTGKLRDGTEFAGTDKMTILFPKAPTN